MPADHVNAEGTAEPMSKRVSFDEESHRPTTRGCQFIAHAPYRRRARNPVLRSLVVL